MTFSPTIVFWIYSQKRPQKGNFKILVWKAGFSLLRAGGGFSWRLKVLPECLRNIQHFIDKNNSDFFNSKLGHKNHLVETRIQNAALEPVKRKQRN